MFSSQIVVFVVVVCLSLSQPTTAMDTITALLNRAKEFEIRRECRVGCLQEYNECREAYNPPANPSPEEEKDCVDDCLQPHESCKKHCNTKEVVLWSASVLGRGLYHMQHVAWYWKTNVHDNWWTCSPWVGIILERRLKKKKTLYVIIWALMEQSHEK